ncbi:hypothetical protein [Actinoplanes sichuanensis]|uniref:Uncharacterized protein n=1 Tax=Actinoplanes sichuanensis TaxID=512349 RepID=A0ABW4AFV8_9ACTN|nr:hypothetical protein [Actinoplanes sichuanensis]
MRRLLTAWRTERVSIPCRMPPHTALHHIATGIDAPTQYRLQQHLWAEVDFMIIGRADQDGIRICAARPHITNDLRTYLFARFVREGSGSRLEGHFGWRPSQRIPLTAVVVFLVLAWFAALGFVARSLYVGYPTEQAVSYLVVIPIALAGLLGMAALCVRIARSEAAHLRSWLTDRLDVPGPPPPRPQPTPPPPTRIRPPSPT